MDKEGGGRRREGESTMKLSLTVWSRCGLLTHNSMAI